MAHVSIQYCPMLDAMTKSHCIQYPKYSHCKNSQVDMQVLSKKIHVYEHAWKKYEALFFNQLALISQCAFPRYQNPVYIVDIVQGKQDVHVSPMICSYRLSVDEFLIYVTSSLVAMSGIRNRVHQGLILRYLWKNVFEKAEYIAMYGRHIDICVKLGEYSPDMAKDWHTSGLYALYQKNSHEMQPVQGIVKHFLFQYLEKKILVEE
jgi:hypothetical protein